MFLHPRRYYKVVQGSGSYQLVFESRPRYLYAHLRAEYIDLDVAISYVNELVGHLRSTEHTRLLLVRDTPTIISRRQYSIIGNMIINTLPAAVRFAMIDHSPSRPVVASVMIEEAKAKHREARVFQTFGDGEAWLLSEG